MAAFAGVFVISCSANPASVTFWDLLCVLCVCLAYIFAERAELCMASGLVLLGSGLPPPSSGLASFTSVRLVVFSLCMEMGRLRRFVLNRGRGY
jgi:hypothetical protein